MKPLQSRFTNLALIVGFPLILFTVLVALHFRRDAVLEKHFDSVLGGWRSKEFTSLTNEPAVNAFIQDALDKAPNIGILNETQRGRLQTEISATLQAYSQGDFDTYMKFRAPSGLDQGVIWNNQRTQSDRAFLMKGNLIERLAGSSDEKVSRMFKNYSLETSYDVAKYTWIILNEFRMEGTGRKPYCTDCWTGISPEQSWVRIYTNKAPGDAMKLAMSDPHLGAKSYEPSLKPVVGTNGVVYAALKLAVHTSLPDNAYPIYIVYTMPVDLEYWIPTSLAKGITQGTKDYLF